MEKTDKIGETSKNESLEEKKLELIKVVQEELVYKTY